MSGSHGAPRGGRVRRWLLRTGVATALLTTAGVVATASPAHASPTLYVIKDRMTGLCLATNGASVYTTGCGSSLAIWYRVYRDGTTFAIKSYAIGGCVAATYGSSALQLNCAGPDLWHLATNGAYTVVINNGTGTVLDSNASGSAYTLPSNGGLYQQWQWIVHP